MITYNKLFFRYNQILSFNKSEEVRELYDPDMLGVGNGDRHVLKDRVVHLM